MNRLLNLIILAGLLLATACSKEDTAPSPPGAEQINNLFQAAIDFEDFDGRFHPEVPGRDTLCLAISTDTLKLKLTKHDVPVRIVHDVDECYNSLIVRTFDYSDSTTTFILDYDLESIISKQVYRWTGDDWLLVDSRLIEK